MKEKLEESDDKNNREVKLGLLAWVQYQIDIKTGVTKLSPEEWLAENEKRLREELGNDE